MLGRIRWSRVLLAGLIAAFAVESAVIVYAVLFLAIPGGDGLIYRAGSVAWLAGLDPWSAGRPEAHYAGSPSAILLGVPLALIPESLFQPLAIIGCALLGLWIVRALRLPLWWLLFPPLVDAVLIANPGVVVLALLVTPRLAALSPLVKVTAAIPLLTQRKLGTLVVAGILGVGTIALAPGLWLDYAHRFGAIGARLTSEVHGPPPMWLTVVGAVSLLFVALKNPRAAGWLALAALWPAYEYHYGILVLPVGPLPALLLSAAIIPSQFAVAAYAVWLWRHDHARVLRAVLVPAGVRRRERKEQAVDVVEGPASGQA